MRLAESEYFDLFGDYRPEELKRRVPTVFIGLGGSGRDVLMRLRKRFFDRFRTKEPGFSRFVFIDTDRLDAMPMGENEAAYAEFAPTPTESLSVPITRVQFETTFRALSLKINSDHLQWLSPELERIAFQSVEHGSGTWRPMGRLAFFLNHGAIRATIERQVRDVLQFAADRFTTVEENRVEVVIVTSLVGGTGSGMVIDIAYLVRDILAHHDFHRLIGQSVTLIGFLPGLFADEKSLLDRLQQNAFATLMELERYGTSGSSEELFVGEVVGENRDRPPGTGFLANWGDGNAHFIRGTGWDRCFLVDNRNDLDPNSPLTRAEIFQMTTDYLALDYDDTPLAIAKRESRHNLAQFAERRKETRIRSADLAATDSLLGGGTDAIFATQNGCGYSSFGLAEIHFDVEKLYRVAAYRLASKLVRSRWIGSADRYPDAQYVEWVKEQLFNPTLGDRKDRTPSFLIEKLSQKLLVGESGASHLDALRQDQEALDQVNANEGLESLRVHWKNHAEAVRDRTGAARRTVAENEAALSGDPSTLGPLRERLRQVASRHFTRFGSAVTLRLLKSYRNAIAEAHQQARSQADVSPPSGQSLLVRLAEALLVPWPARNIAMAIEFDRARRDVDRVLRILYDKVTGEAITEMFPKLGRYVGSEEARPYPELARHGTLHDHFRRAEVWLRKLAGRLEEQFDIHFKETETHRENGMTFRPRSARRNSLAPLWDKETYDRKIDEALVCHPAIDRAEESTFGAATDDLYCFDWERFEVQFWDRLGEHPRFENERIRDVDGLARYAFEKNETTDDDIKSIADAIAEACQAVLRGENDSSGSRVGGLPLRDEGDGNAIDFLVFDRDWEVAIERMVKASAPYFPSTDRVRVSADFMPAFMNLYSQTAGHQANSLANANRVLARVRDHIAARSSYVPNQAARLIAEPLAADGSTIILVREMSGFPLQWLARLDELRTSYDKRFGNLGKEAAHIDYRETDDVLPRITIVGTETYALIRDHVTFVLRALIIGEIRWIDDEWSLSIPDFYGPAVTKFRLGRELHRMIELICQDERRRLHLVHVWTEWSNKTADVDWACFYASCRLTWARLNPERDIRQSEVSSPLRNGYRELLSLAKARLTGTTDGRRWYQELATNPLLMDSKEVMDIDDSDKPATRMIRSCLRRIRQEIPIYRILADKLGEIPRLE